MTGAEDAQQERAQKKLSVLRSTSGRNGCDATLQRVDLSGCGLTQLPEELRAHASTLTFLNLGGNRLSSLPDWLADFSQLRILFFANNEFREVPEVLGKLPSLYMLSFKNNRVSYIAESALAPSIGWLILTGNQIAELPASIGRLHGLRKLMLSCNCLTQLPDELALCRELELVRLADNKLREIPVWLMRLPRLSWLALAGNPCAARHGAQDVSCISLSALVVQEKLGSGASGDVHKALWKRDAYDPGTSVALKLFAADSASDGLADDEIAVTGAVGYHPNILQTIARVQGDNGEKGLAMELLDKAWRSLGQPPSFDSVTRDVYDEGSVFTASQAVKLLRGIASALAFIHSKGIVHGDVYAHNILVTETCSRPLLSDWGAAFFYERNSEQGREFEAIEVRAFGCLMEEVLDRVHDMTHAPYLQLRQLQRDCLSIYPSSRPSFETIASRLAKLAEGTLSCNVYDTQEWLRIALFVIPMMGVMMYLFSQQQHADVDAIV